MRTTLRLRIVMALFSLPLAATTLWASADRPPPLGKQAPNPDFQSLGLDPAEIRVEQLGLLMRPPAGAVVHRDTAGSVAVLTLTDPASPPAWRLRIQPLVSRQAQPTAASIAREHLDQLQATDLSVRILDNTAIRCGDVEGWLLMVQQEIAPLTGSGQAAAGASTISGWLILPTGQDTFLIFALLCAGERYPSLRPILDNAFSTVRLQPVADVNERRAVRLEAGRAFLAALTPERLRGLAGRSQWFRVYRSTPGGERELGYSTVEITEGQRGALNEKKPEQQYTPLERDPGLVVRVQARLALDAERGNYADSIQTYWMAWDRSEEAWSVRATRRQGEAEATEVETGVRSKSTPGTPGRISIDRRDTLKARHDPGEWGVPDVYLSQPEHWVLGHLLPRDDRQPREYSFYYYQSRRVEISQRIDRWQPAAGTEAGAAWELITRLNPDEEPATSTYDQNGAFIKQVRPDGTIIVPSTQEQIRRLWQAQGLKWGVAK